MFLGGFFGRGDKAVQCKFIVGFAVKAAGEHGPAHLRLGLCIDVGSGITEFCEDSSHPADTWPSENDPLAASIGYLNAGFC